MKLKLSELNANEFKKEINNGKLNEESINKIRANIKELGLMGSLPVYRKQGKYYLVSGHHRVEALKREFGNDFYVECIVHNYTDHQVLKGMVIENLTQRTDELMEVTDNLSLIRKYLLDNNYVVDEKGNITICPDAGQMVKRPQGGGHDIEIGSCRQIALWLDKESGEVMSKSKIAEYLKVAENLDKRILKTVEFSEGGIKSEGTISIEDAKNLARLEKQDQFVMRDILDETKLDHKEKSKLVTEYLQAPEEIKEKVKNKEIEIIDVPSINSSKRTSEISKEIDNIDPSERAVLLHTIDEVTTKLNVEWIKLSDRIKQARKIINKFDDKELYKSFNNSQKNKMYGFVNNVSKEISEFLKDVKNFSDKIAAVEMVE